MIRFLERLNTMAAIRTWAMFLAGPPLTFFAAWIVWIVWHGGWPVDQASRQLDILGKALWIVLGLLAIIIVALAAAKVRAQGVGGSSFEIESGQDTARPSGVTVTTEVKPHE